MIVVILCLKSNHLNSENAESPLKGPELDSVQNVVEEAKGVGGSISDLTNTIKELPVGKLMRVITIP